jgi:hypothetical protein
MKTISTENKQSILKYVRKKGQIIYNGNQNNSRFPNRNLKVRRAWNEVFKALKKTISNLEFSSQKCYYS